MIPKLENHIDGEGLAILRVGGGGSGGDVTSVNGKTGAVVLDAADVHALPDTTVIPERTSQIINDSGFVIEEELPTKTSELINDSDFVADPDYVHTDNDFTNAFKNKLESIETGAEVNVNADWNATSGDAQILNKPTIPTVPTNVSAFTNDAGYLTLADLPIYNGEVI